MVEKNRMDRVIELAKEVKAAEEYLAILKSDLQQLIGGEKVGNEAVKKDRKKWNGWARKRLSKSMTKMWDNLTDEQWKEKVRKMQESRKKNRTAAENAKIS